MAETMVDVYIKILQLLIIITLLLIMVRREREGIKVFRWFIAIFAFSVVHGMTELVIYYIKIEVYQLQKPSQFRFNELHTIPYAISVLIIYIFAENIVSLKLNPYRLSITIALLTSFLTLYFFEVFDSYAITFDHPATSNLSNTLFDFYQLWVLGFFSYVHFSAWRMSENTQHKKAIRILFLSTFTYVISILWEIGEDLLNFPNVYGALTIGLSILILAFTYLKYPYFVFSVPSRVYRLVIASNVHQSLIYSAKSLSHDDNETSSELFTSAMSSITEFISSTTGGDTTLNFIDLGERCVVIARGELVSGIIVTSKPNRILQSALKQLVREFEGEFGANLKATPHNISQFEDCTFIVARCFPFIEPKEILELSLNTQ